jgi:hypothetical protein
MLSARKIAMPEGCGGSRSHGYPDTAIEEIIGVDDRFRAQTE